MHEAKYRVALGNEKGTNAQIHKNGKNNLSPGV